MQLKTFHLAVFFLFREGHEGHVNSLFNDVMKMNYSLIVNRALYMLHKCYQIHMKFITVLKGGSL